MISSTSQIFDTIIDDSYWPLAMSHAALLRNLTPRGNRKQSAYEKLTGKSPCELLSIVQPFGASCFVHDSNPDVQKLDPKAWKATMLDTTLILIPTRLSTLLPRW